MDTFSIGLRDYIRQTRNAFIPRDYLLQGDVTRPMGYLVLPGVTFALSLNMRDPTPAGSYGESITLSFVLCGGTQVYVSTSALRSDRTLASYVNLSNHDSCWIDAIEQFVTKIYFDFARKIAPDKAPAEMEAVARFEEAPARVIVTTRRDNRLEENRRLDGCRVLVDVKPAS